MLASAQPRTALSAVNGINVLIENAEAGQNPEVVLDMHGNPIVLSHDENGDAVLVHCDDPMCVPAGESSRDAAGRQQPSAMALTLSPRGCPVGS